MKIRMAAIGVMLFGACSPWPGIGDGEQGLSGASRISDPSGNIGSECGSAVTCLTGLTCVKTFPGGMCSKSCGSTKDCTKVVCQYYSGSLLCLPTCYSDQMCRDGYTCVPNGEVSVCIPGRRGDAGVPDAF